jgi:hypothetical protein
MRNRSSIKNRRSIMHKRDSLMNVHRRASNSLSLADFEPDMVTKSPVESAKISSKFNLPNLPEEDDTDSEYSFDSDGSSEEDLHINPFSKIFTKKFKQKNRLLTRDFYAKSEELSSVYK